MVQNQALAGNPKRLVRLFGVNLECQLNEFEPSTPDSSSMSSQGYTQSYTSNYMLQEKFKPIFMVKCYQIYQFFTRVNLHVGHLDSQGGELQIRAVATFEPKCSISKEDGHSKSRLGGDSSPASARLGSLKLGDSDEELDKKEEGKEGCCSMKVKEMWECRICQEKEDLLSWEAPCARNGTPKFAHKEYI